MRKDILFVATEPQDYQRLRAFDELAIIYQHVPPERVLVLHNPGKYDLLQAQGRWRVVHVAGTLTKGQFVTIENKYSGSSGEIVPLYDTFSISAGVRGERLVFSSRVGPDDTDFEHYITAEIGATIEDVLRGIDALYRKWSQSLSDGGKLPAMGPNYSLVEYD